MITDFDQLVDDVARKFHETYEEKSAGHGWETQKASRREWPDVPAENKNLMLDVVRTLVENGVIAFGAIYDE